MVNEPVPEKSNRARIWDRSRKSKTIQLITLPLYEHLRALCVYIHFITLNMYTCASMDKSKLIEAMQSDQEICAAILFGSEANKMTNFESDIDIALLYNIKKVPSSWDLLQFQQNLTDLMQQQVDIVVLNNASPIIAMQAIKNGIPLFIRDQKEYQKFEIKLITDYADLKKIREPFEKNILKRRLYD